MSRRKTVLLKVSEVQPLIKSKFRSYTVFCEVMGRPNQRTWVTEWNRGKNLPSPEETAKICEILEVKPEQILVSKEDIELVNSLISQKETPTVKDDGPSADDIKLLLSKMSVADLQSLMGEIAAEMAGRAKE